jgi:putative peptidoglycan lipid II flippase
MLPAAVGLIVLREPLIQLLFERGRFGEAATARTAVVLLAYSPQLPFTALDQLFIVAYYARKDTRTPVAVGVVGVFVYLAAALALIGPLDAAGLALANAIQNSFHCLVLLVLLERLGRAEGIGALVDRSVARYIARVLIAALVMGMSLAGLAIQFPAGEEPTSLALALATATLAGTAVYLATLELLGVRDLREVVRSLRRRAPR